MSTQRSTAAGGAQGTRRAPSRAAELRRAGFDDVRRAEDLLNDLTSRIDAGPDLVQDLAQTADPDRALLTLARIAAATHDQGPDSTLALQTALRGNPDPGTSPTDSRRRLLAVLGASAALGDELVRHPHLAAVVVKNPEPPPTDAPTPRELLLTAIGADPTSPTPPAHDATNATIAATPLAYRTHLLQISATDLTAQNPSAVVDTVAAALADLAGAALEAALAIARAAEADNGAAVRFAVIGMGKCGGRELNYVSDVDVIYVVEPADGHSEEHALRTGARLAAGITRACSAPAGEPALWTVDTALRPEGANGPIVRTLASHTAYYKRWAKTWEFQALLRARPVAGDVALGSQYLAALGPMVWQAASRENFVAEAQTMRRRVEAHIPAAEADRELKLGPGGLRDIEFTVQLLQLVHGRSDESIRSERTLEALSALSQGGYVGRSDADRLEAHYRFLRVLEHRIQLDRMRRSHLLPTAEADLRRLGRSMGLRTDVVPELLARTRRTRSEVRELHEALFYRPLLPVAAQLSAADVAMSPDAVSVRLTAIGYRDPAGAMRHLAALTEGVSRTAAIQRQLLPVMLGWFAQGADPDAGLLGFRQLSDQLGRTPWYLKLLRDSGTAAPRLAHLLSSSPYLVQALARSPESVKWLADDRELVALTSERLRTEVRAILTRAPQGSAPIHTLRALRRRELARTAAAELLHLSDPIAAAHAITTVTDVVLIGTLEVAERLTRSELDLQSAPTRMLVMAMGRFGGRDPGYGSDADVLFVHEPHQPDDATSGDGPQAARQAQDYATAVAVRFRRLLGEVGTEPALEVDADLRPEGRNGPLVRTLDSYAEYFARWGQTWERQALLGARPVAGETEVGERFTAMIDPFRFPADLGPSQVTEIRRVKARVERERLPRAVDPVRHLKLGPGGIGDVEWTVQLLQLQHAHAHPRLRTTSTLDALAGLSTLGFIASEDADVLRQAWLLGSGLRNALALWTGRVSGVHLDVLPVDRRALSGLAGIMDYPPDSASELEEDYLRAARRARQVVERVFYGRQR